MRVLITGANGRLGRRLIQRLESTASVRAVVRSDAAARSLESLTREGTFDVRVLDYTDAAALAAAASGCTHAVHLVGIIKESSTSAFVDAHERSTIALAAAAAKVGIERVLYLSILGAAPTHSNACLASKGRAEALLLAGAVPSLVLRVPMVLGEGDPATRALAARASSRVAVLVRGDSLEQPIYANDVVEALVHALAADVCGALDLAGPVSLPRRALVQRAARVLGTRPKTLSLPLGLGLAAAWLLEQISRSPPLSRAMLGVLDHDDAIDPTEACRRLRVELTPLDEMLAQCLEPIKRGA